MYIHLFIQEWNVIELGGKEIFIKRLKGNIYFIEGKGNPIDFGSAEILPACNSLVIDDKVKAIIDPASDLNVLRNLAKNGKIDININTHYHGDHMMFNPLFNSSALYVHKDDAPCYESSDELNKAFGVLGTKLEKEWRANTPPGENNPWIRKVSFKFKDGDIFEFGDTLIQVVHTPGHTPGFSCLYFPNEKILYTGDYDLSKFGPWYAQANSDLNQFIQSAEKLKMFDANLYVTGHKEGIVNDNFIQRMDEYISIIYKRDEKIIDKLEGEITLEELSSKGIIYDEKALKNPWIYHFEKNMIEKHLDRLIKMGKIIKTEDEKFKRI